MKSKYLLAALVVGFFLSACGEKVEALKEEGAALIQEGTSLLETKLKSDWVYTEKLDKLLGTVKAEAEYEKVSEDEQLLRIKARLWCKSDEGVVVEITTHRSTPTESGELPGLELVEDASVEVDDIVSLAQLTAGTMFSGNFRDARATRIRIDEHRPDATNGVGVLYFSQYNNQGYFFPFDHERILKKRFEKVRVGVNAKGVGSSSFLIDFQDPNVSKIVEACEGTRFKENAATTGAPTTESLTQASPPAAPAITAERTVEQQSSSQAPEAEQRPAQVALSELAAVPQITTLPQPAIGVKGKPSFDCSKASRASEVAICSDAELSELDANVSKEYKMLLANAADPEAIKASQIAWIRETRLCQSDVGCLKEKYNDRIIEMIEQGDPGDVETVR